MMLWTAFVMGMVGSLHCVGMCGPIALALPGKGSRNQLLPGRVLYNFGRVVTYSMLGLMWGILGEGVAMAGYQQGFSIAIGVMLLLGLLFSLNLEQKFFSIPVMDKMLIRLKMRLGKLLKVNTHSSLFSIGLLNGLLPCGFVYLALAGALTAGDALDGMAFMTLFGLGTFPLMLATSLAGSLIKPQWKQHFQKIMTGFAFVVAVLFIIRGMNLGIPYLSPELVSPLTEVAPECH
ncbi:MAG: sulfite exporter TauE/SafE family protein [Bacteroidota bacterium]